MACRRLPHLTPERAPPLALLLALLAPTGAPLHAATGLAQSRAVVIEPATVGAALTAPVSVQELVQLLLNAPALGTLVLRLNSAAAPQAVQLLPLRLNSALDTRQAFGVDLVASPDAALLPRGLAAAVSAAAAEPVSPAGDGGPPLVITVAFN